MTKKCIANMEYHYTIFDPHKERGDEIGRAWPYASNVYIADDMFDDWAEIEAYLEAVLEDECDRLSIDDGYQVGQVIHLVVYDEGSDEIAHLRRTLTSDDLGDGQ